MVKKYEKLFEKMRNNSTGWKRTDVDRVYKGYGFVIESGGNHDKVYHPEHPGIVTFLPRHTKLAPYVIRQLVSNIEKLKELQRGQENE